MKTLLIPLTFFLLSLAAIPALAAEADYHYAGKLDINEQTGHIDARWQISVHDDTETAITFLLRNTLSGIEVDGPGVASATTGTQSGMEDFHAINITLAEPGDLPSRIVQIAYSGVLIPEPMENRINAIEEGRVELNVDSFWFPIDARFNKVLTADLAVTVGEGWQGVTTGEAMAMENGFRIINTDPRMDIAFTLSKTFHITEAGGFTIYDQRKQHAGVDRLVSAAQGCRAFLNTRFGMNDPLPAAKLLITERPSSGYARENYIVLTDIAETLPGPLTRFVCHEFAHYWSSGAKFDTVDNWLNEAFAEYIGLMAVRESLGQQSHDDMLAQFAEQIADKDLPHIWKLGDTERGPYEVQYRKAPLVLARLEQMLGEDLFLEVIVNYFDSDRKTTEGLLEILERTAGTEQRSAFERMLGE